MADTRTSATSHVQELLAHDAEQETIPQSTLAAAVNLLKDNPIITTPLLQKNLKVSYAVAVHIIDKMKKDGLINEAQNSPEYIAATHTQAASAPTAPQAAPPSESNGDQGGKRTRTTVAKLLQGYKDREAEADTAIAAVQQSIQFQQMELEQLRAKKMFLRELIDEIEQD